MRSGLYRHRHLGASILLCEDFFGGSSNTCGCSYLFGSFDVARFAPLALMEYPRSGCITLRETLGLMR
jgi:hypothetical protein